MVLIFSRVQRCNIRGAPNGFYKYWEQFDAPQELAEQLVAANVCGYVSMAPGPQPGPVRAAPEPAPVQEPEPAPDQPTGPQERVQEPARKGKNSGRR